MYPLFGDASRARGIRDVEQQGLRASWSAAPRTGCGAISSATCRRAPRRRALVVVPAAPDRRRVPPGRRGRQPRDDSRRAAGNRVRARSLRRRHARLITLRHTEVLAGTETVAIEVRDRRMPERVLSRDVLARGVDYQLEPATGTVFLQRHVSGLDPQLNLVQIVIDLRIRERGPRPARVQRTRIRHAIGAAIGGMTFFTEEGAGRQPLHGRRVRSRPAAAAGRTLAARSPVQPRHADRRVQRGFAPGRCGRATRTASPSRPKSSSRSRSGTAWRAGLLQADDDFRNPFSATITPGAGYCDRLGRALAVHEPRASASAAPTSATTRRPWTRTARRCPVNGRRSVGQQRHAQGRLRRQESSIATASISSRVSSPARPSSSSAIASRRAPAASRTCATTRTRPIRTRRRSARG